MTYSKVACLIKYIDHSYCVGKPHMHVIYQ